VSGFWKNLGKERRGSKRNVVGLLMSGRAKRGGGRLGFLFWEGGKEKEKKRGGQGVQAREKGGGSFPGE